MYRKLFVVGLYCLMTLFLMSHLADAQTFPLVVANAQTPVITGPWLWMIAPNGTGLGGAASTDVDSLAVASNSTVTEADIAIDGAQEGDFIGNYAWTRGELRTTGIDNTLDFIGEIDNVTDLLKRIGWADGEVLNHSSYALITLESAIAQNGVTMRVGSDDSIKVWLNGRVVFRNPVNRGSGGFQDDFQVNLKRGDNLLLVKVSQGWGNWSMFVGVDASVTPKAPVSDDLFDANGTDPHPPNGLTTSELGAALKIYWTEGWGEAPGAAKIRRANPDGSNIEDLFTNQMAVTRLSVDTVGGKLYWMDGHGDGTAVFIRRSNFNGSDLETLVESTASNLLASGSLTLDVANGRMYWRNWGGFEVTSSQSANLDGSDKRDVLEIPAELDDNAVNGKIYWHDRDLDIIRRSNLDGSRVESLVREEFVSALTVDGISGKMYWHDYHRLRRANLDGSNVETLRDEDDVSELTIDGVGGKMYWRNYELSALRRANLDGSNAETIVSNVDYTPSIALLPDAPTSTTSDIVVNLSPASIGSPAAGQELILSLDISNGENIVGYEATVSFDTLALRYVESSIGDYFPPGAFFVPPSVSGNRLVLAASSLGGDVDGDGTLATVTFEVLSAKASTVGLSDVLLVNAAGGSIHPRMEGAEITEPSLLPADVNGDGVVNIIDLTLVAAAYGETAASPSLWLQDHGVVLTRSEVASWLRQARAVNLSTPRYQQGIRVLAQLLAALTPAETTLLANYPNPFNPETWIPYQLATPADVTLRIYAVDGSLIRRLSLGHKAVGLYQSRSRAAYWDGKNETGEPVASGVYFYTFTADDFTATRKMLIRK